MQKGFRQTPKTIDKPQKSATTHKESGPEKVRSPAAQNALSSDGLAYRAVGAMDGIRTSLFIPI